MDGVILDSEPIHYRVEKELLGRYDIDFQFEEHATFVGQTTRDLWDTLCVKYHLPEGPELLTVQDNDNYLEEIRKGNHQPMPGVLELIKNIEKAGFKMVVASSAIHDHIKLVLDKFDLQKYFAGYVSGQDVSKTKPNPEIFLKAAELIDTDAKNCVVIEDAAHGVQAAKSAGMACIAFRNLNSGNQDLSKADAVVNAIGEIDLEMLASLALKNY